MGGLRRVSALLGSLALALCGQAPVEAQSSVNVTLGGAGGTSRTLSLPRGKSAIIDLPVDARDVLVSNPQVADAVLRTPRRIYVLGVAPGQTDAVFFDGMGRQILSLDIRVDSPTAALVQTLRKIAPDSDISVDAVGDSLVLTGSAANASQSDAAQRIAERFAGKPEQVINMIAIRGGEQVMLKVRVVEMQRNLIKQFGVNTNALMGQVGEAQYLVGNAANFSVNGGLIGGLSGGWQLDTTKQPIHKAYDPVTQQWYDVVDRNSPISTPQNSAGDPGLNQGKGVLQAFERVGLVRTLAEPNLTAVSGESAKFLAGGEFPVPVGLDQNGNVIVQFKPFGVGLGFTPVVLSGGRISLKVSTEVSELTSEGSLKFNESLTIPGLSVRRAETTVEMPSGGAMMIAGLLQEKTKENIDGVPGMTNLPVLGSLFRSRDYLSGETELVVIIEPYLVRPASPKSFQTPVDGLQIAGDAETLLFGRLNRAYGRKDSAGRPAEASQPPQGWRGPIGYVIE